jgi:hypothetical protein
MKQIIYALQFKGHAGPSGSDPNVLAAKTTAVSSTITTSIDDDGISGVVHASAGEGAAFESKVTLTGESSFQESGAITFGGEGNWLRFSTVGQGYIGATADPKLRHGTVNWRIDSGGGQFKDAAGLITSNFTVSDTGEVIDNQFGVIFVK